MEVALRRKRGLSFDFFVDSHAPHEGVVLTKLELLRCGLLVFLSRVTAGSLALFAGFGAFQRDGDAICFSCHGRLVIVEIACPRQVFPCFRPPFEEANI